MHKLLVSIASAATLGIVGCGPVYPSGPGYTPGPVPAGIPVHVIQPGAGTIIQPGTQAGYGITANVGASYRVVWTGDAAASGGYREFQGSIYTAGTFLTVDPGCGGACPLEAGDIIGEPLPVTGGERIDFDTTATTGVDGLDFTVSAEPVYFDLYIDGRAYPELVFFTDGTSGDDATAAAIPFALTTH